MVGPVPIDFAQPTLKRELNKQLPGYGIDFQHTVIAWQGWRRGLDILVTEVVLRDERGLTLVDLPALSVGLDPMQLLRGKVAPNRIDLLEPTISLSRRADGSFGFRHDDAAGVADVASEQVTEGFVAALLTEPTGAAAGLTQIGIDNATILIGDLAQQQDWRVEGATLNAERTDDGLRVDLEGILVAGDNRVGLKMSADYSRFTDRVSVGLDIAGAVPSMLQRPVGPLAGLAGWDVPVSGSLLLNAAPDGRIDRIEFDLQASEGTLNIDTLAEPAPLDGAVFKAVLDRNAGRLDISKASLLFGGGVIDATAVLSSTENGVQVEAEADIDRLPFRTVAKIWPAEVKASTRRWFDRNIRAGRILNGKLNLSITPKAQGEGADTKFRFAFGFEGLELHYIRPMPPMTDGSGSAVLLPGSFEIRVDRARIVDPETGLNIKVASVYGLMSPLDQPVTHTADITLAFTSGASDILTLIDYQPLGYASAYGLAPTSLAGDARVKAEFRFPLIDALSIDDVELHVFGMIDRFDIAEAPDFVRQTPGSVSVVVDRNGLEADGRLFLWDTPVDVSWQETFRAPEGTPSTRYKMQTILPQARLVDLGMPDDITLSAPLPIAVALVGKGTNIAQGQVTADLTAPAISIPAVGWSKQEGEPGQATATLATVGKNLLPQHIAAKSTGLDLDGEARFDGEGRFTGAVFSRVQIGKTDLRLTLGLAPGDIFDLRLDGRQLDLRPFLDDEDEEEDQTGGLHAVISIDVDRIVGARELAIDDVGGVLWLDGKRFAEAQLAGRFPTGETLFIDYHPEGNTRSLTVQTDNAGSLVAALDLYDGAKGGRLSLEAVAEGDDAARVTTGTLDVRNFKITGAPGLARILTLGSLTGIVDTLSGDGLSFDRLKGEFRHRDGELTISKTQAVGSQLGIKMEGRAYNDLSTLDIRGTLAPAYSLNTALNLVPLVGAVLSGGSNEGLFAVRFSVTGPIDNPDVSVNALSALTPGLLRGIFDVFDPPRRPPEAIEPAPAPAEAGSTEN